MSLADSVQVVCRVLYFIEGSVIVNTQLDIVADNPSQAAMYQQAADAVSFTDNGVLDPNNTAIELTSFTSSSK